MKRIGLLAVAIVLSLGLVGAGFAYWNETLNIDADVDTGELDMQITAITKGYDGQYYYWEDGNKVVVATLDCKIEDEYIASFTLGNWYPGAWRAISMLIMKNTGSIPVKIEDVSLEITPGSDDIKDYVLWRQYVYVTIKEGWTTLKSLGRFNYTPIDDMPGGYLSMLKGEIIMPGQSVHLGDDETEEDCVWLKLAEDCPSENASISFNLKFKWTQFNAAP